MITRFQTSGAIAGIAKWSCALRMPTASPLSPSSTTIGNSTRLRPDGQRVERGVNSLPVNGGMINGATRMKTTVIDAEPDEQQPGQRAGELRGLLALLLLQQLA